MSGRLGMNKCRLTSLIRLSYLAPDIVRALLEGRQPIELTPTRLLRLSKDLPHDWSEQRQHRNASPSRADVAQRVKQRSRTMPPLRGLILLRRVQIRFLFPHLQ